MGIRATKQGWKSANLAACRRLVKGLLDRGAIVISVPELLSIPPQEKLK